MKTIKIILAFFIIAMTSGCGVDDNTGFFYELVPIETATVPDSFVRGETYTISVTFFRPTSCHAFAGFDYTPNDNERTVAVVNLVVNPDNCRDLEDTASVEESLEFFVGNEESYVFRFWQGRDDQGNNQYLTIEVPVEN